MHHGIGHMVTGGRWSGPGGGRSWSGGGGCLPTCTPPPPPPRIHTGTMVFGRAVRILLECILVDGDRSRGWLTHIVCYH